jgi:dihydropteroate synthase
MAFKLNWSSYSLDLDQKTHVMGVINVTPDSFSDGGQFYHHETAIEHGIAMAEEGADMIDIGGESTRPYSEGISEDEELERVIPVIQGLIRTVNIPISIDTQKAMVARHALKEGASIINDISALRSDPALCSVAAEAGVPLILMHMRGTPANMQQNPVYADLIGEILDFLREAKERAVKGGVRREMIIVDPGIGFGKNFDHNLQIIKELERFRVLESPILLGSSRKAFIGHILDKEPMERDTGTMATVTVSVMNGAHIVRVHDVKRAVETVKIVDAIKRGRVAGEM